MKIEINSRKIKLINIQIMIDRLKTMIKGNDHIRKFILWSITPTNNPRPRFWVKWFINPFIHQRAIIRRRRSRIDVFPWNQFIVGKNSLIEDFTTINNGAGHVIIGDNARVGIGSVIIGPVRLGNKVGLGQHVFISGFKAYTSLYRMCRSSGLG